MKKDCCDISRRQVVRSLFCSSIMMPAVSDPADGLNVCVLDWSFGLPLPATLLATALAAASLYLIATERRVYARLLAA